jgi:diguanylate cyclase (GGDEF)-like protein/PAS domain S-box-containing protein
MARALGGLFFSGGYVLLLALSGREDLAAVVGTMMVGTLGVTALFLALLQRAARRANEAAARSQERTRQVIDASYDAFVSIDEQGRIQDWNPQAERLFGWTREEAGGRDMADTIIPPAFRGMHREGMKRFLTTGEARVLDKRLEVAAVRRDGSEFPVELTISALWSGDGYCFNAFIHDISDRKQAQEELSRLAAIVAGSHDAVIGKNLDATITSWNKGAQRLYGYTPSEVCGMDISILVPDGRRDEVHRIMQRLKSGEAIEHYETVRQAKDGRLIDVSLTISPIHDENGAVIGASSVARDITEQRQLVAELEEMSRTDFLTGLPNRRAWREQLDREVMRAMGKGHPLCVVLLDLDRFKDYNDQHGHPGGDQLLKGAATSWRSCLRQSDLIGRYGGEEFAVLLPDCAPADATLIVERIRQCTPNHQTCSAGIAYWDGSESAEGLIHRADTALYQAKRAGRDRAATAER